MTALGQTEYPACLDMIAGGVVDVDAMISATAPLAEGASWFQRLYDKEAGLIPMFITSIRSTAA